MHVWPEYGMRRASPFSMTAVPPSVKLQLPIPGSVAEPVTVSGIVVPLSWPWPTPWIEIDPAQAAEKVPETAFAVCEVIAHWKFVQLLGSGSAPEPAGAPDVHTPSNEPVADEGPVDGTELGEDAVPECW